MQGARHPLGVATLTLLLSTAALAEPPDDEGTFALDLHSVAVVDVLRSIEKIVARPILGGDIDRRLTVTLLTGSELARRDVIPVASFAFGLVGLTILETPRGELRVEPRRRSTFACSAL